MSAIEQWDVAVRAWRKMLAQRPLGMFYKYPTVPIPEELALRPKRYSLPNDYPLAFWTMNSIARGA